MPKDLVEGVERGFLLIELLSIQSADLLLRVRVGLSRSLSDLLLSTLDHLDLGGGDQRGTATRHDVLGQLLLHLMQVLAVL